MAEVVAHSVQAPNPSASINGIFTWLGHNWPWVLLLALLIVAGIVIIMLINKLEEDRKQRDEPGYQLYMSVCAACTINRRSTYIRKTFNPMTLPLIFIPFIGWILMFLIRKEHSVKLVDWQGHLIGYYRGDFISQDNSWNFLIYRDKWLIFFEKTFVLKCPLGFDLKKPMRDKSGKMILESDGKTPLFSIEPVNLRMFIKQLPNEDYQLQCTSIEPLGLYYKCPVYIIKETGEYIDYRKIMEGAIVDGTYQIMVTRLLNLAARQMEKGMSFSPDLQYNKQSPVKTKPEDQGREGEVARGP